MPYMQLLLTCKDEKWYIWQMCNLWKKHSISSYLLSLILLIPKGLFVRWSFSDYFKPLKYYSCVTPRETECSYLTRESLPESEIVYKLPEPRAHHGLWPVSHFLLQRNESIFVSIITERSKSELKFIRNFRILLSKHQLLTLTGHRRNQLDPNKISNAKYCPQL